VPDEEIVRRPGEGDRLEGERRVATIKVARDELVVVEFELEPGFEGPKPHLHRLHVDSFFVLDGEPELGLGDERFRAAAGTFVAAPPGVVHTFSNPGPGDARLLNIHAPGLRFDEYLRELDRGAEQDAAFHERYDVHEVQ
jgi:quercetin dioxygenase-like cupin family protein